MGMSGTSGTLRQELIARNAAYAEAERLPHALSYGKPSVVVYRQSECGRYHGNFIPASYQGDSKATSMEPPVAKGAHASKAIPAQR